MAASQADLKTITLNLSYARNQSLPNLSLRANTWSPGVSGTRILYLNDDPITGVITGTVPGGASLARLHRVMGTNLEARNISAADLPGPSR